MEDSSQERRPSYELAMSLQKLKKETNKPSVEAANNPPSDNRFIINLQENYQCKRYSTHHVEAMFVHQPLLVLNGLK
jgi:hypothetical protein